MLRLAVSALAFAAALPTAAQVAAPPAYVYPFSIAGDPATNGPSACPANSTAIKTGITDAAAAQIAATVTFALQQQLTGTGAATLVAPGAPLPAGTVTFTGCLTRLEAGSKGKRVLVGMGSGGSFLAAHVVIAQNGKTLRDFNLEVKGSNVAPPVFGGAIYNLAHLSKTSLDADAPRLAEKIVAQFRATTPAAQNPAEAAPQPAASTGNFNPTASAGKSQPW